MPLLLDSQSQQKGVSKKEEPHGTLERKQASGLGTISKTEAVNPMDAMVPTSVVVCARNAIAVGGPSSSTIFFPYPLPTHPMSSENKTTVALQFLLNQKSSSPEAGVMMAKKETFAAIAQKYQRMEEALQRYIDNSECSEDHRLDETGPACKHCQAAEALAFDPLSAPSQ